MSKSKTKKKSTEIEVNMNGKESIKTQIENGLRAGSPELPGMPPKSELRLKCEGLVDCLDKIAEFERIEKTLTEDIERFMKDADMDTYEYLDDVLRVKKVFRMRTKPGKTKLEIETHLAAPLLEPLES